MDFRFTRDEGMVKVYVGDVCVSRRSYDRWHAMMYVHGVTDEVVQEAIHRANDAGFFDGDNDVTVSVYVAETNGATLSLTMEDD